MNHSNPISDAVEELMQELRKGYFEYTDAGVQINYSGNFENSGDIDIEEYLEAALTALITRQCREAEKDLVYDILNIEAVEHLDGRQKEVKALRDQIWQVYEAALNSGDTKDDRE